MSSGPQCDQMSDLKLLNFSKTLCKKEPQQFALKEVLFHNGPKCSRIFRQLFDWNIIVKTVQKLPNLVTMLLDRILIFDRIWNQHRGSAIAGHFHSFSSTMTASWCTRPTKQQQRRQRRYQRRQQLTRQSQSQKVSTHLWCRRIRRWRLTRRRRCLRRNRRGKNVLTSRLLCWRQKRRNLFRCILMSRHERLKYLGRTTTRWIVVCFWHKVLA